MTPTQLAARNVLHAQIAEYPTMTLTEHSNRLRMFERVALRPDVMTFVRQVRLQLVSHRKGKKIPR